MSAWIYIVGILVLLLALLLLTRVGAAAEYDEEGFSLRVRLGLLRLDIQKLMEKNKGKGHKKPKKEKKEKKPDEGKKPKKGGTLKKLKALLPGVLDFLGGFRRKLLIDELTVRYVSAGEDPAKAALAFGYASAAVSSLTAPLERVLRIKKKDLRASVSFEETEPRVYLKAEASIRIGQLLYLAIRLAFFYLRKVVL